MHIDVVIIELSHIRGSLGRPLRLALIQRRHSLLEITHFLVSQLTLLLSVLFILFFDSLVVSLLADKNLVHLSWLWCPLRFAAYRTSLEVLLLKLRNVSYLFWLLAL